MKDTIKRFAITFLADFLYENVDCSHELTQDNLEEYEKIFDD